MPRDDQSKCPHPGSNIQNLTMADLIHCVKADGELSENRKRNMVSSIRRFCDLLEFDPEITPASYSVFREAVSVFSAEAAGITQRRFQNIKSDVSAALKRFATPTPLPRLPLSNAWQTVRKRALDIGLYYCLSGFPTWCNANQITPNAVSNGVVEQYRAYLEHQTFKSNPKRRVRSACLNWNKLVPSCEDLGLQAVTLPVGRETYSVTIEDMHPEFRDQLEAWLSTLSTEADLFDLDAPSVPLRQSSIDTYRQVVRRLVGALVHTGHTLGELKRLDDLIALDHVRDIIEFFVGRSSVKGKITDSNVMHVLRSIARYCRPADTDLHKRLKQARGRVSPGPRGMGKRPREALRQFDDPEAIDRLIMLPQKVIKPLLGKNTLTRLEALLFQSALILELLLMRPIRLKNLTNLKLGETIALSKAGARVIIAAEDVKNSVELDYALPASTANMLREFVERALPVLGENPNGFLFPGDLPEKPKAPSNIGKQLTKFVREKTALYVTVHKMRQIGLRIYQQEKPEDVETMRQVLGHKSIETTTRFYIGLQNQAAIDRYDQIISARRNRLLKGEEGD